ncbi:MAG: nickel pincer cofactor biosynthesis protein LarC [Alphaproteobacteria bacterium]
MKKKLHIHLDPIGGISGDMFISSMIDAEPSLKNQVKIISSKIIKDIKLSIEKLTNNHISGTKFNVDLLSKNNNPHRSYKDIKLLINRSSIDKNIKEIAIDIFHILAKAESEVHGVTLDKVSFHEIGAWDSIIDNIISAFIINKFNKNYNVTWSCSATPIGSGMINTAHGILSVPAPATALILKSFPVIDDGIKGERTTPTGAAILSHLKPLPNISSANLGNIKIHKQGIGIGSKDFKTIPNILRVLIFKTANSPVKNTTNEVISEINFDIDDQTPEDLALSLNTISKSNGVIDIIQNPTLGKKGRVSINIKILCRVEKTENIIKHIFNETSTIGLRHTIKGRYILSREIKKISHFNIKVTKRPSGKFTKKVESNDLKNYSYKNRKSIKSKIENN